MFRRRFPLVASTGAATAVALLLGSSCSASSPPGTASLFDVEGNFHTEATFFDHPFPSDLRLSGDGAPDLSGYPDGARTPAVAALIATAAERDRFPVTSTAYFRFTGPLRQRDGTVVVDRSVATIVDVDPLSPRRGEVLPVVVRTFERGRWTADNLLAVAPRPGYVLSPNRTYAAVVMRSAASASGDPLELAPEFAVLADGGVPEGELGSALRELYSPLWPALDIAGIPTEEVAAATVFTTGDEVLELAGISDHVLATTRVTLEELAFSPEENQFADFCTVDAVVRFPQYQSGSPPFPTEGSFVMDEEGRPIRQRNERARVALTIPRREMPARGYPLLLYFHGSGGVATQLIDRGPVVEHGGEPTKGEGPAAVVARYGIAAAGSSLPVNPERLPGADPYAYLNIVNPSAFRDTFRQGVIEQRLLLDALLELELSPELLGDCVGAELPEGATAFRFDPRRVVAMGQSMGGAYTNMIGAVEPRLGALVPTGAGGMWPFMLLQTRAVPGAASVVAAVLGVGHDNLHFTHPALQLLTLAWEGAEPFAFMPRLSRRPLPGHPARSVYQPVGENDAYFPTPIYDAAALAYRHAQSGEEVWPEMQALLAASGDGGFAPYPVTGNRQSEEGGRYTGVVVQYAPDEFLDGHDVFAQRPEVRFQYGCFFHSFVETGVAVLPEPATEGTPCALPEP